MIEEDSEEAVMDWLLKETAKTERLKKLGSQGTLACVDGIAQALRSETQAKDVLRGMSDAVYNGTAEAGWREAVYPLLMEHAITHPDKTIPWQASSLAMAIHPVEATRDILQATPVPSAPLVSHVDRCTRLELPDDLLAVLALALLPHHEELLPGSILDHLAARLAASGWDDGPEELTTLLASEKARQEQRASGLEFPSRAYLRLEKSALSNIDRIFTLFKILEARHHRQGIKISYNPEQADGLKHMTRPEWVIHIVNHWVVGTENPGNLREDCHTGIQLLAELEEVGLPGCIRALRAIAVLQEEEQAVYDREEAGELSEDESCLETERLLDAMEKAEREAETESWEECADALWSYAVKHQLHILPDDGRFR